jgi:hypothetical protein
MADPKMPISHVRWFSRLGKKNELGAVLVLPQFAAKNSEPHELHRSQV